nr:hypothetical protein [Neokomagataea thailandica]
MTPLVMTLAPVIIAIVVEIVHAVVALVSGHPITMHLTYFQLNGNGVQINEKMDNSIEGRFALLSIVGLTAAWVAPLAGLIVTCVYACSGFLRDRRDQSILFWKSLPMPESAVVLARILFCCIGIPFVVFCAQLLLVTLTSGIISGCFALKNSMMGSLFLTWGNLFSFLLSWFEVLPQFAVLMVLWWFPIWALLLLWSGIVRSYPLLWLGVVLGLVSAVEAIANGTSRIIRAIGQYVESKWIGEFVIVRLWNGLSHIPNITALREKMPSKIRVNNEFWSVLGAHSSAMFVSFIVGIFALIVAGYLRRKAGPL